MYLTEHITNYNSLIQALFLNSLTLCASKTTPHLTFPTEMTDVEEQWSNKNYAAQINL